MKVLVVTPKYPPSSRVGAWLATHLFMRHLVSVGHEVTVVAFRAPGRGWEYEGVKVTTGKQGKTATVSLARDHDVVVSHFGDGGFGATVARRAGLPSVQMVHGHIRKHPASADLVVFNSQTARDQCVEHRGPSIVCHPPTDPADHRVPSTGDMVTIVNLCEPKGIRTAWRVSEKDEDRKFLGVKGGYGTQVQPRTGSWEILPVQTDMREVWSRTRVLLMPSQSETWGMVGIEAMCSGIPVIAHPCDGLKESLGPAGIFADRDDPSAWVDALRHLDDPDNYAAASAAALARVDELDPMVSLERFRHALEDLCGS